jgi:hypothetical protein
MGKPGKPTQTTSKSANPPGPQLSSDDLPFTSSRRVAGGAASALLAAAVALHRRALSSGALAAHWPWDDIMPVQVVFAGRVADPGGGHCLVR